jgi:hypothetical protein
MTVSHEMVKQAVIRQMQISRDQSAGNTDSKMIVQVSIYNSAIVKNEIHG